MNYYKAKKSVEIYYNMGSSGIQGKFLLGTPAFAGCLPYPLQLEKTSKGGHIYAQK